MSDSNRGGSVLDRIETLMAAPGPDSRWESEATVVLGEARDALFTTRAVLVRLAGTDPEGMDGLHFVGDEDPDVECPGCIAREGLDAAGL